jgi:hypothetical protein
MTEFRTQNKNQLYDTKNGKCESEQYGIESIIIVFRIFCNINNSSVVGSSVLLNINQILSKCTNYGVLYELRSWHTLFNFPLQ